MTSLIVNLSGIFSTVLAIGCSIPYIASILQGKTKPHQFSWIIFAILNAITALSQFLAGGRLTVLVPATFFVINLITITLSFKYGVRDTSRFDRLIFIFCLLTIVFWILTKSNALAIWLAVLIDFFATAMMILKIKAQPYSEAILPWALAMLAYTFSLMTLINKHFGILYVRPLYGFLSDAAMVIAIYYFSRAGTKKSIVDNPGMN